VRPTAPIPALAATLSAPPPASLPTPEPPGAAAAVDAERARLRSWLHDGVLQALEYVASGGYADVPDASHLQSVAASAAAELRAFVDEEDEPEPGLAGLAAVLRAVVTDEQLLAPHPVHLLFGAIDGSVTGEPVHALAAATREALTNVRKHARASEVVVICECVDGVATVLVSDDGEGFAVAGAKGGAGLRQSLVARLARLGGTATIDSRPGGGTRVRLRVSAAPGATELDWRAA